MKWQPDMDQEELGRIKDTFPFGGWTRLVGSGLQYGAWYADENNAYHIRIPWKKALLPGTGIPAAPDGQVITAHDTHLEVLKGICPLHDSILDVGGYDGIWAWLFEARRKVVLDVCQEALERWAAIHADIVCEDARNLDKLFASNEFDVVFLLDVLEHMKATSALKCIRAAEKIAKYQVIVATPDGYQPFDDYGSILTLGADVPCVELMAHRSGWGRKFFENRGYKVIIQPDLHKDIDGGDGLVCFYNKWEM